MEGVVLAVTITAMAVVEQVVMLLSQQVVLDYQPMVG
jgi:hypothetical protein